MLLKIADRFPGGRTVVFLLPLILFLIGTLFLEVKTITQVCNWVILALTAAVTYSWRRSIPIFLKEQEEASAIWLSLGVFIIVIVTVLNVGYSSWLRAYGASLDTTNSLFVAFIRFAYAFAFGCLYLVPLARDAAVPPRGWVSLLLIVFVTASATILMMWLF